MMKVDNQLRTSARVAGRRRLDAFLSERGKKENDVERRAAHEILVRFDGCLPRV